MADTTGWKFVYPTWYSQAEWDAARTQQMAEEEAVAETVAEAQAIIDGPGPEAEAG